MSNVITLFFLWVLQVRWRYFSSKSLILTFLKAFGRQNECFLCETVLGNLLLQVGTWGRNDFHFGGETTFTLGRTGRERTGRGELARGELTVGRNDRLPVPSWSLGSTADPTVLCTEEQHKPFSSEDARHR